MAVNLLKKNSLALVASLLLAGHVQATELLNSSYDVSRRLNSNGPKITAATN